MDPETEPQGKAKAPVSKVINVSTVCPRSLDPIFIVTYCIKWVKTSWTDGATVYLRVREWLKKRVRAKRERVSYKKENTQSEEDKKIIFQSQGSKKEREKIIKKEVQKNEKNREKTKEYKKTIAIIKPPLPASVSALSGEF